MNTWTKICRACLNTKESFSYVLFENVPPDLFFFCTSVEIHPDELPRSLCNPCYEQLTKYSAFKNTCIQSQNSLLKLQQSRDNNLNETEENKSNEDNDYTTVKVESYEGLNSYDDAYAVKEEVVPDTCDDDVLLGKDLSKIPRTNLLERKKIKTLNKHKMRIEKRAELKEGKKSYKFHCDICNTKFFHEQRYLAHQMVHEGKEVSIQCKPCNKLFMTWSGLHRHNEREHTLVSLKNLSCIVCGKICKSRQSLQMHRKIHDQKKIFICSVCGKGFSTKFVLKTHVETHKENRERLFTCEHCGKKFFSNTILSSHISKQHTGRRYICQVCSYPFNDKCNLAKHLLIHEGVKLYKCDICSKSFATQSSLVEHKRIHSGERPYNCNYCPKSFLSKRRLDDHHMIHTGERPHKCSYCGQGFIQRGTLKRHMKIHDKIIPVST